MQIPAVIDEYDSSCNYTVEYHSDAIYSGNSWYDSVSDSRQSPVYCALFYWRQALVIAFLSSNAAHY